MAGARYDATIARVSPISLCWYVEIALPRSLVRTETQPSDIAGRNLPGNVTMTVSSTTNEATRG